MKRTTVYLPDEMHLALRRAALEKNLTMAKLIRVMGEFYLSRADLFWHTIEELQSRNETKTALEVETDAIDAIKEIRSGKKR